MDSCPHGLYNRQLEQFGNNLTLATAFILSTSRLPEKPLSRTMFSLYMKRANLLASNGYLASNPDFMDKVAWLHFGNANVLCSRDTSCPVVVSLVGVAVTGKWYNKLSGLGDFDKRYPKGPAKLKWLLYIVSPVCTIFMG